MAFRYRWCLVPGSHLRFRKVVRLCMVVGLILFASHHGRLYAEEPGLVGIIKSLEEWRRSFADIRLKWELIDIGEEEEVGIAKQQHPNSAALGYGQEEWFYADHGLMLHEVNSQQIRNLYVWNTSENYAYNASFSTDPLRGEVCTSLQVRPLGPGRPQPSIGPMPFYGLLQWQGLDEVLAEMDVAGKVVLEGEEDIDGLACVRIKVPGWGDGTTLWLSPSHGYLVKKQKAQIPSEAGDRREYSEFIVHDYDQLDDGFWMPMRGEYRALYQHVEWKVTEVTKNNGSDDPRLLVPKPDIGTHVTDSLNGRVYRVTHAEERLQALAAIVDAAKRYRQSAVSGSSPGLSNPTRTFPSRLRWPVLLLVVAFVMLISAKFVRQRKGGSLP